MLTSMLQPYYLSKLCTDTADMMYAAHWVCTAEGLSRLIQCVASTPRDKFPACLDTSKGALQGYIATGHGRRTQSGDSKALSSAAAGVRGGGLAGLGRAGDEGRVWGPLQDQFDLQPLAQAARWLLQLHKLDFFYIACLTPHPGVAIIIQRNAPAEISNYYSYLYFRRLADYKQFPGLCLLLCPWRLGLKLARFSEACRSTRQAEDMV